MGANFALVLILVRILSPNDYAGLVLTKVSLLLVTSLAGLGLSQAVVRWVSTDGSRGQVLGTALTGAAALAIPATAILSGIMASFSDALGLSFTLPLAGTTLLAVGGHMVNNELVNWARACHRAGRHAALSGLRALLQLIAVSSAVFATGEVAGFVAGVAVGELSFFLISGVGLIRRSSCRMPLLTAMLHYGWPFTFVIASSFFLIHVDRYMLAFLSHVPSTVAYYDAGYTAVSAGLALLVRPFNLFLFPAYTKSYNEKGAHKTLEFIDRSQRVFLLAGVVIATGLVVFRNELLSLLYPVQYAQAEIVFAPVAFATLVNGVFIATAAGLYLSKRTIAVGVAAFVAVIVNVTANAILIPRWGMGGAAIATAIASVVQLLLAYRLARSVLAVPLPALPLIGSALWLAVLQGI